MSHTFCFHRTDDDFKAISTETFTLLQALARAFLISAKVKIAIFLTSQIKTISSGLSSYLFSPPVCLKMHWSCNEKVYLDHLLLTTNLLFTHWSFTTFISHSSLLSQSYVLEKLNCPFNSNVPVFRGQVDAILNFSKCLTLGITLVQNKPAKMET